MAAVDTDARGLVHSRDDRFVDGWCSDRKALKSMDDSRASLPAASYRDKIVEAVRGNQVSSAPSLSCSARVNRVIHAVSVRL